MQIGINSQQNFQPNFGMWKVKNLGQLRKLQKAADNELRTLGNICEDKSIRKAVIESINFISGKHLLSDKERSLHVLTIKELVDISSFTDKADRDTYIDNLIIQPKKVTKLLLAYDIQQIKFHIANRVEKLYTAVEKFANTKITQWRKKICTMSDECLNIKKEIDC